MTRLKFAAILLTLLSCNTLKNRDQKTGPTQPAHSSIPVRFAEFDDVPLTEIGRTELVSTINSLREIYFHAPLQGAQSCPEAMSRFTYFAGDQHAGLEANYNLSDCFASEARSKGVSFDTAMSELQLRNDYTCSSGGMSVLGGLTAPQAWDSNTYPCQKGNYGIYEASRSQLIIQDQSLGQTQQIRVVERASTTRQHCQAKISNKGILKLDDDCFVRLWVSQSTKDNSSQNIIGEFRYQNVEADLRSKRRLPFFDRGTISFDINGWKGKLSYLGPETTPTWSAKKGSAKLVGSFGEALTP